MIACATHIDHVDVLRAGATETVLGLKVMAPSTIGTFLRSFTFGFVRQLDAVACRLLTNAWTAPAGPGDTDLVIDVDSAVPTTTPGQPPKTSDDQFRFRGDPSGGPVAMRLGVGGSWSTVGRTRSR